MIARRQGSLERARGQIAKNLELLTRHSAGPDDCVETVLARISATTDLAGGLAGQDLIFEAIPESPDVKREIYKDIGREAPPQALVASTTSGLNIYGLAPGFPHPQRLIIAPDPSQRGA